MEIKHIQDHLMSVEEGYVRCFLIEGETGALVIDGGVETGLRKFVEKQTSQKLTFLLTHRKFRTGLPPYRRGLRLILSRIILRSC